jgi:AcrR family transcriptional regulator
MPKVTVEHLNARRAQIIDAARACFMRKGFARSTIQDICQEASLSPGAIYRYFKSKDDIVLAIGDQTRDAVLAMVEAMRDRRTALEILDFLGEHFFGSLAGAEGTIRVDVELWAETLRNPKMQEVLQRGILTWRDAVAALIEKGQAEGLFDASLKPRDCAAVFIAMYLGLEFQLALHPELVDVHQFYDAARGLIWREAWDRLREGSGSQQAMQGKE